MQRSMFFCDLKESEVDHLLMQWVDSGAWQVHSMGCREGGFWLLLVRDLP